MKKRAVALLLSLTMIVGVMPYPVAFSAETETITHVLGGEVLWSAPDGYYSGTEVDEAFEGWSADVTGGSVDVQSYAAGTTLRYYNPSYAVTDNITWITSPGYGSGSEKIIIEWLMYHDTAKDLYFDFSFRDINDTEIAFLKLDKNAVEVGYSHPESDTDYYAMGYPDNGERCAIVAYNNPDGTTHTAQYYVEGVQVSEFTDLKGSIDGFKSISSSNGFWTRANMAMGFTNLTVGSCNEPLEVIENVSYNNHVYMIKGTKPVLPAKAMFTGSKGSEAEGTISWNEPDEYIIGENTLQGTASVMFDTEEVSQTVSLTVTCYPESFALGDLQCSKAGDKIAYFPENIYGEFFLEFDFNMTNLRNCWIYLSRDAGLWGNGQIGMGTPDDTSGTFKAMVSSGDVNVNTDTTYHLFVKGNASEDKYSLIMTDADTGELVLTVTDRDFRKNSEYINSIHLSVNGASGNFTVKNIRCYAEELTKEPTEEPTEKQTRYSVIEDAYVRYDTIYGINTTNSDGVLIASSADENRGPERDANGETTYLEWATPTTLGSTRVGLMKFPVADIEENEKATLRVYVKSWHNQGFDGGNTFLRIAVTPLADSSWDELTEGSRLVIASEPLLENWTTPVFSEKAQKGDEYFEVDVTEMLYAAKNEGMDYISFKMQIFWGAVYCVEREAALTGGSYEGLAAYIELSEEENLYKIDTSGDATLTKNGSAMNGFAYVTDEDDVRLQLEDTIAIGSDNGYYTPNEKFTVTEDVCITNTLSLGFGLTMVDGAQVRYGSGLDANGNVGSGNGLRFITIVDRTDTLAGQDDAELGVMIAAEDSDAVVDIPAEKWQSDTVFTSALTNLSVNNYNRNFTATPYVKTGGKIFTGEGVTRSIYKVAAGILVKGNTDSTEYDEMTQRLFDVLNAYVNQVGIRLTFSDNDDFSDWELRVRDDGKGSYTGDAFFEVGETYAEGKVYSVRITPLGENTVINDNWNSYVRINNNNSQVKLYTMITDNNDGTYTLSFDTSKLIMGTYPEEKFGSMKPTYERAVAAMEKANSYWQGNTGYIDWYGSTHPAFWDKAAYHTGNIEMYKLTGDESYLQYSIDWANYNDWMGNNSASDKSTWTWGYNQTQGSSAVLFGDWQICFQTYIDLYNMGVEGASIDRVLEVIDYQISKEEDSFWWWADGLYMVMPVMTKLYKTTGEEKYLDALYKYFKYAKELMYDGPGGIPTSAEGYTTSAKLNYGADYSDSNDYKYLFYRDAGYVYPLKPNSGHEYEKNFWARGNGWVFAGLAKVLDDMPEDYRHYDDFYQTYIQMAQAIVDCQQSDANGYGFWTQSMLQDYPKGTNGNDEGYETSGTAFFTYGLFRGINSGILTEKKYEIAAIRAWGYLEKVALHENGKVGYIQPIGSNATQAVSYDTTANFGVGAYLLACCEAARWAENQ
ncbi:MAG: glycoside hydrolase family 88 protein [Clostridia bacterium]|nr:glycoside hydrolase family 88 protein [Clostridia bacterium]